MTNIQFGNKKNMNETEEDFAFSNFGYKAK